MEVHKIVCACGSGLGSSLMVEMNVNDVLKTMDRADIQVTHCTLDDVKPGAADLYVVSSDLANKLEGIPDENKLVLSNIVDKVELADSLTAAFAR